MIFGTKVVWSLNISGSIVHRSCPLIEQSSHPLFWHGSLKREVFRTPRVTLLDCAQTIPPPLRVTSIIFHPEVHAFGSLSLWIMIPESSRRLLTLLVSILVYFQRPNNKTCQATSKRCAIPPATAWPVSRGFMKFAPLQTNCDDRTSNDHKDKNS